MDWTYWTYDTMRFWLDELTIVVSHIDRVDSYD